ncbi:enoyl-CoA hydratase/isomerase family protein [Erythrobacter sp. EC-HK427]|uniref:enoyl-CoA hydratase/isomerase family protein n=1 Tax=Erythrobacter sp. EC-HK427 TaxID=2038396 RepID=UPI00125B5C2F|nr:enoyl-CoA hydratase-related protein [Erythrobacter sp. EC-HK427]VVT11042.1 Enoyl-CoA hydratase [Erythrobacter sp. EC-HK427]
MSLRFAIEGRTAHLLIDRVDKRNAFTRAMWEAVPELLQEIAATEGVRALVLRSATPGGVFCAGADIAGMAENAADADWCAGQQAAINAAQLALARFALPTIAFVEGDAIGGGCALAMACDIRVATPQARFGITPSRLGLAYPLHDVKLLVDLVGPGQAKRLLFTGALIDAAEALRIGLVEVLEDDCAALLDAVLAGSPQSIRVLKGFVARVQGGQGEDDADSLASFAAMFRGPDFTEGTAAFRQKRKPDFQG